MTTMVFVGHYNPEFPLEFTEHPFTCPNCRTMTTLSGYNLDVLYKIAGRFGVKQVDEISANNTPYFSYGWYGNCCNCEQPLYALTG